VYWEKARTAPLIKKDVSARGVRSSLHWDLPGHIIVSEVQRRNRNNWSFHEDTVFLKTAGTQNEHIFVPFRMILINEHTPAPDHHNPGMFSYPGYRMHGA
jgi:hypothetical protein